ncbi:MFS transporter [Pseudomaricurvus alkylphenolicus]|uniref:MFS transporter n=1 Tax=Pseudomaricurvus alkylphenolicus TaxID=1306991 RepID=UPI00142448A9|nr:MFS transporter [Pseudomaricurvus alkylphenolicus]NIB38994.1 MFS transporter [Pseudomaricurvus alkylphenolicus]
MMRTDQKLLAAVCVLGPALVSLIPMAAAPTLPALASEMSRSGDGQFYAQLVMTVPAIALMLFSPVSGLFIEKYGVRRVLLASLLTYAISGFAVFFTEEHVHIIALRLLLGVAGGGVLTACLTLIGDQFKGGSRERLLGYATALASIFAALAMVFGGVLVDLWGWKAPFSLYLMGLPVFVAAWRCAGENGGRLSDNGVAEPAVDDPNHSHLPLLSLWPYYLMLLLLTVGMFSPSIQGPFALESRGLSSASDRGMILGLTSVMAFFSASAYGRLRDRLSAESILVIDFLCMGIGFLTFSQSTTIESMAFGCAIIGVGAGMSEPAIASIVIKKTPVYLHGLAMGLIVSALNGGQFSNPLLMDPLRHWIEIDGAFMVLALTFITIGAARIFSSRVRSSEIGKYSPERY